ncbi:hypothetical protein QBC43DRAFT_292840 [Cladorrhinum sp. PSN259]|nr:hypothetical protein QBC43DRAFT_292840 [Cladorrhinum sp. PSN259]
MPLETVGLLLGVISVTIESSDRVASRISSYRNYNKRVSSLATRVISLQTRFTNNGRRFNSNLDNNRAILESWLAQAGMQGDESSASHLGPSRPAAQHLLTPSELHEQLSHCLNLVNSIKASLETIDKELTKHEMATPADNNSRDHSSRPRIDDLVPIVGRAWGKMTSSRVAFAILKKDESFSKAIKQLEYSNNDFASISRDVMETVDAVSRRPNASMKSPRRRNAADFNIIEKYQEIRSASNTLYHTMAKDWVCLGHRRHSVSVSFVDGNHESETVKFDVALSVSNDGGSRTSRVSQPEPSDSLWLEIEHFETIRVGGPAQSSMTKTSGGVTSAIEVLDKLDTALQRQREGLPITAVKNSQPPGTISGENENSQQNSQTQQLIDLLSVNDFCGHFIQHSQASTSSPQRQCIGRLERQCTQRFYLQPMERRWSGNVLSLPALISWVQEQHYMRVLDAALAHGIASNLAMALLHFHNTPWLCDTWQSKDLQFFNKGGFSEYKQLSLSNPRLRVELERQDSRGLSSTTATPCRGTTQNELPFRFGIVLLELGLSSTWESLRQKGLQDFRLSETKQNEYHIAVEWWKKLKDLKRVGPRYLAVTWECIAWDFSPCRTEHHDGDDDSEQTEEGDQILFFAKAAEQIKRLNDGLRDITRDLY